MRITDLTKEQITQVKQNYIAELVNEGTFAEVMGVDYDEPSWDDMANVDKLVPDETIFDLEEDTDFSEEDFFE